MLSLMGTLFIAGNEYQFAINHSLKYGECTISWILFSACRSLEHVWWDIVQFKKMLYFKLNKFMPYFGLICLLLHWNLAG